MLSELFRLLFWRRGVLLLGLFFAAVTVMVLALAATAAGAFLLGTGVVALVEINANILETVGVGVLVGSGLWILALLVK